MCGILFCNDPDIGENAFYSAAALMSHRGPDAPTGYKRVNSAQLGHRRLKIVDLDDRSNQPFYSHDGRYVIVFNGEIYNYKELARKYSIQQRTTSDTEVLVELYARYGPEMLNWLNGMWAFVIVDTTTGEHFIARDRLGVKPLYFREVGQAISVASEIAPLLAMHGTPEIDPIAVRQYRKLRTFFNGRTIYSGIQMFPAGHYLLGGKLQRYWDLPRGKQLPPDDEELRTLIDSAVKLRRIADVPVGSYLSGGLDSTIVAALSEKPHTWTVGFETANEFEWGRLAAQKFGADHMEVLVGPDEFVDTATQMIRKRLEPLSVPNEVLLFRMTQMVKTKNTVVLSGEGADELFFGYDRVFRWASDHAWNLEEFSRLYAYGSHGDLEIVEDAVGPFLDRGETIDIVASFFQVAHLHGLLRRLDNSTMLCSVEARVPFLDYRLIERMAGVPFAYRMKDGEIKAPLKRVFRDLVPPEIISRKKVGFPVPLDIMEMGETEGTPMDRWLQFNLRILNESLAGAEQ